MTSFDAAAVARTARQRRRSREALQRKGLSMLGVLIFVALWEVSGRFQWINPLFTSSPSLVVVKGWEMISSGQLTEHVTVSALPPWASA